MAVAASMVPAWIRPSKGGERCPALPGSRSIFVLFCFVYLLQWVRWDMSDRGPWCLRTGGFLIYGLRGWFCGLRRSYGFQRGLQQRRLFVAPGYFGFAGAVLFVRVQDHFTGVVYRPCC
jgi:hypothetical protein